MNRKSTGWAVARGTLWGVALLFCLALGASLYASGPDDSGSETRIYLPYIVKMSAAATTSSAVLARPPAAGQLGILAGLLAIGFLIGIGLVFSPEPESMTLVRSIDEQNENAPPHPPAQTG